MTIVADQYELVIGVDTHAASHTLSIITTATGAVDAHVSFPASPAGLDRARAWITRRAASRPSLVVVEGIGSYGPAWLTVCSLRGCRWSNLQRWLPQIDGSG